MCLGAVGDIVNNEVSHIGNIFDRIGSNPAKSLLQLGLGAADPITGSIWGKALGTHFEPFVNALGGETDAQYEQSERQGVNTTMSRDLGYVADAIALYEAGSYGAEALGVGGAAGATAGEALGEGAVDTGAAGGAEAGAASAGTATGFGGVGTDAAVAGPGAAAGGGAAAGSGAASAGGSSSIFGSLGKSVAGAAANTLLSAAIQPKPPKTKAPTLMPDPLAEEQAQRDSLIQQIARRGRAASILTSPGGGTLGG